MQEIDHPSYKDVEPLLLAVDCIIFGFDQNQLKVLIFQREVEPLAGGWSLIGSFVKRTESTETAAQRVLSELTALNDIYMEQLHCFSDVNRDEGGRVVSVAYWSLIKIDHNNVNLEATHHTSKWVNIENVPDLVLDHNSMIQLAIEKLRERARHKPIGFELLPEEFTLPQLLRVYQSIFQKNIDDRNFRKKILKSGLLLKTDHKDMSRSKKGSYLYKFDSVTYKKFHESGYDFKFD